MKAYRMFHALLIAGLSGVFAKGTFRTVFTIVKTNRASIELLHDASKYFDESDTPTIQNNFHGWVNPEDLIPMPQCIAQQDQSAWLRTMTKCTHQRCTSHFGVICTHHQWLTQLSCLSTEFSSNNIRNYLPYCSRSILAKAQLYHWIRNATGRTWLVDVGDANGLQNLSPASLAQGYADINVIHAAPTCLTNSSFDPSKESFQHVLGSCSFTGITQHTGNAVRPWEYNRSFRSMTALSFDTVGYDLAEESIRPGEYFDRECFCDIFAIDLSREPCLGLGRIELTRERLWLNATCGPAFLPDNWTVPLKIMGFAYIPINDWHWPMRVMDMPKRVTELTDQCATDACQLDLSGYCEVRRAIDRACFCRSANYDSCQGPCQIYETRVDYVEWLRDLCGGIHDWHGLQDNWRELTALLPRDMIPWRWTVKPANGSNITSVSHPRSLESEGKCPSNQWKLGSIALVNAATLLAVFFGRGLGDPRITIINSPEHSHQSCWFFKGICLAGLQILANWINGYLIQSIPGYEDVPIFQLTLLWCSLPRLGWLTILPTSVQHVGAKEFSSPKEFSSATSSLFAETILQILSSYYMLLTVDYGREHNFYLGGLTNAKRGQLAMMMYAGALMWLIVIAVPFIQAMRAMYRIRGFIGSGGAESARYQRSKHTTLKVFETNIFESLLNQPSVSGHRGYGTLHIGRTYSRLSPEVPAKLYTVATISMPLIWIAQWFFWVGFVGLSYKEYVFVHGFTLVDIANRV